MTQKKSEDIIVTLSNVRIAFPQLFVATQVNGQGKAAFSASFLMPPGHPDIAKVKEAITRAAREKWGDEASVTLQALVAKDAICLHNGDHKSNLEGYAGNMFVSARGYSRPLVINADKTPLTETDGKPYSGCYVNAQVSIWAQQNKFGKRVNAQLRGVQFLRDGEAFSGGGVAQADDFEAVDGSADGDAPPAAAGDEFAGLGL
jgi:hypothetical protein